MIELQKIISSGIIEEYCLGIADDANKKKIDTLRLRYSEIETEIVATQVALEHYAGSVSGNKKTDHLKSTVLSILDNLKSESEFNLDDLPLINRFSDFKIWNAHLAHIQERLHFENEDIHILSVSEKKQVYLVWLKSTMCEEEHTDFNESILLLEGTCFFRTGTVKTFYKPGDYIEVPRIDHEVIVTSKNSLKFVVQRLAKVS